MSTGQTFILRTHNRALVHSLIEHAPDGHVVNVREPKRTLDQNALMWVTLSDISRACPEGRNWSPDTWKAAFMQALGHEIRWEQGIDGREPFPVGFRTSKLNKRQMADLITMAMEYGDRHGVRWSDRQEDAA